MLAHNGLMEIPVGAFKDLKNLRELDLSFNEIDSIETGTNQQ